MKYMMLVCISHCLKTLLHIDLQVNIYQKVFRITQHMQFYKYAFEEIRDTNLLQYDYDYLRVYNDPLLLQVKCIQYI